MTPPPRRAQRVEKVSSRGAVRDLRRSPLRARTFRLPSAPHLRGGPFGFYVELIRGVSTLAVRSGTRSEGVALPVPGARRPRASPIHRLDTGRRHSRAG